MLYTRNGRLGQQNRPSNEREVPSDENVIWLHLDTKSWTAHDASVVFSPLSVRLDWLSQVHVDIYLDDPTSTERPQGTSRNRFRFLARRSAECGYPAEVTGKPSGR
jgi:hypothetical protein